MKYHVSAMDVIRAMEPMLSICQDLRNEIGVDISDWTLDKIEKIEKVLIPDRPLFFSDLYRIGYRSGYKI